MQVSEPGPRDHQAGRHTGDGLRLARTPEEAGATAQRMGCPVVIKSQVLTGGRMKAGGVRFADTPAQAEALAREILELEIGGQIPRGVLVDPRMEVEQELYAEWSGTGSASGR